MYLRLIVLKKKLQSYKSRWRLFGHWSVNIFGNNRQVSSGLKKI